jgi:uncharacterized protein (DUF983 family)
MTELNLNNPTPQFGTAEYGGTSAGDRCRMCQQPIGASYFRLNDAMVCPSCADKMQRERSQDTHAAFVRAITAGIGAAVVGLVGYALLTILLQGWQISYMSFAVGWLVGVAMMKASGGVGGRRYQIAAVLLTYVAVSLSAVPIWIYFANKEKPRQTEQQKMAAEQRQLEAESGKEPQAEPAPEPEKPRLGLGTWLGRVTLLGLASPFIELRGNSFWGVMGLFILFVGMRMAWRITAGRAFQILGPFQNSPPQNSPPQNSPPQNSPPQNSPPRG